MGIFLQLLFDLASGLVSKMTLSICRNHHGSHSEIIEFSNQEFYELQFEGGNNYDRLNLLDSGKMGYAGLMLLVRSRTKYWRSSKARLRRAVVDEIKNLSWEDCKGEQ